MNLGYALLTYVSYEIVFILLQSTKYVTIGPWPFSDLNTGLTDQTCDYSAICADQFLVKIHFNSF